MTDGQGMRWAADETGVSHLYTAVHPAHAVWSAVNRKCDGGSTWVLSGSVSPVRPQHTVCRACDAPSYADVVAVNARLVEDVGMLTATVTALREELDAVRATREACEPAVSVNPYGTVVRCGESWEATCNACDMPLFSRSSRELGCVALAAHWRYRHMLLAKVTRLRHECDHDGCGFELFDPDRTVVVQRILEHSLLLHP